MNKKIIIAIVVVLGLIALFLFINKSTVQNPAGNNIPSGNNTTNTTPTNTTTSTTIQNNTTTTTSTTTTVPTGTTSTADTTFTAKLGQSITFSGVNGTLTEVVEDSLCPIDVQCIQAGTVRVKVHFSYGLLGQDVTLTLNQPFTMYGYSITLVDVKPQKTAGVTIAPADKVFTFSIK